MSQIAIAAYEALANGKKTGDPLRALRTPVPNNDEQAIATMMSAYAKKPDVAASDAGGGPLDAAERNAESKPARQPAPALNRAKRWLWTAY
jgi:hypothetical protein